VINGEKQTGVTTFKLQHAIDTGNILLSQTIDIGEDETAGELHDKMKEVGADLLLRTVEGLANNNIEETPQLTDHETKHAPKLFTETAKINWANETGKIYNLIRGLSPYPGAFTELQGKTLKIFRATKEITAPTIPSGNYETDGKKILRFATADGYISVTEIQLEGKKRMGIEEFLRGMRGL
jgi:methionyl-tRNA formyltransferase